MGSPAKASRASCWRAAGGSSWAGVRGVGTGAVGVGRMAMPRTPWAQERLDTLDLRSPGFFSCACSCYLDLNHAECREEVALQLLNSKQVKAISGSFPA